MKKIFTSLALMGAIGMSGLQASAQTQPLSESLIKANLSQVRFMVNTPTAIAGLKKKVTIATWGGQANPALLNVPIVRGFDSLALNTLTNPGAINGKAVLLYRGGGVTFAQKAQYAVAAGAIAVVIVNNVSIDPIVMGNTGTATYTVPIVHISKEDGDAINNALIASQPVTISIGSWNLNVTNDIAILPGYQSAPHALNMPWKMIASGANKLPYRNFSAGAVVNYGTAPATGITVTDTVRFTPTGGSATTVHTGSYSVPTINTLDSVKFGFAASGTAYSLPAPTGTGIYTYQSTVTSALADQIPQDNTETFKQYANDSIFCKGLYDYERMQPSISLGIQPSGVTTAYSMGPLYYVAGGRYYARKMQYYVSKNSVETLDGEEAYALLFKWVDGSNSQPLDSFAEGDELKLVGLNRRSFNTADSNGFVFTVNVTDPNNLTKPVILDSNSWYWTSVQATSNCFIGVDNHQSYFTRSFIQSQQNGYPDMPELLWTQDYGNLSGSGTALAPFPFGGNAYNIDSTFYDRFYYIPNIALHLSKNEVPKVGVNEVVGSDIGKLKVFPSPATTQINIDLKLNSRSAKAEYRLLDISGKVVYKLDRNNVQNDAFAIPCDNIPSGIYYLAVFTENGQATEKVVIRH
jgi:hypothetical protein